MLRDIALQNLKYYQDKYDAEELRKQNEITKNMKQIESYINSGPNTYPIPFYNHEYKTRIEEMIKPLSLQVEFSTFCLCGKRCKRIHKMKLTYKPRNLYM